jgi:flagella basal body P-ring formation protein FlgA
MATLVAVLTGCGLSETWANIETYVAVKDDVWVKGEKICLKDVAHIQAPAELGERLGATYLAYAPSPGKHKTLHGSWIESKVRSKGWLSKDTVLKIPEFVRVRRAFQSIERDDFLRRYTDYVSQRLKVDDVDFRICRFRVIGNGHLPEGNLDVELTRQGDGKLMGHISLNAVVRVNGKIERRVVLSGWVDRFERVVCALRRLPRHAIIAKDDLCMQTKNVSKLATNVIKASESVAGKRTKHAVKAGSVLFSNTIEDAPVIRKGDRVTIIAKSPTLVVTTIGIAQGEGSAGDQIRVRNCTGKKEIIARIVDGSTVRVEF